MRTAVLTTMLLLPVGLSSSMAATITTFGDFADTFGSVGVTYSTGTPYDPGVLAIPFHGSIEGIEKFDPSLGVLTDITVFVEPGDPIKYTIGGGMTVTESVPAATPDYGATISLMGSVELNYDGAMPATIFGEGFMLSGGDVGAAGSGSFMTPITSSGTGILEGSASVLGIVDPLDFVGTGFVDTLYVDLIVQGTAEFTSVNATAEGDLGFDVFAGTFIDGESIVGVTYTYTAVPEPSTMAFLGLGSGWFIARRRRRTA